MTDAPVKNKSVGIDLTQGNILKLLIQFTIPLLLANFIQQLYNTVDMIVIGQYVGNIGTVGVSTGGDVATMLTFVGTSLGTAGQYTLRSWQVPKKNRQFRRPLEH